MIGIITILATGLAVEIPRFYKQYKIQKKVKYWEDKVRADPNKPGRHVQYAAWLKELTPQSDIISRELETAVKIAPTHRNALLYLAEQYERQGMLRKAIDIMKRLVSIDIKHKVRLINLYIRSANEARVLSEKKRYIDLAQTEARAAIFHLESELRRSGQEPPHRLLQDLLGIYHTVGDIDKAVYYGLENIKRNPKDWRRYNILGDLYAMEGKHDLAIEYYNKAYDICLKFPVFEKVKNKEEQKLANLKFIRTSIKKAEKFKKHD